MKKNASVAYEGIFVEKRGSILALSHAKTS